MSIYLENDYFTAVEWSTSKQLATVTFPPNLLIDPQRHEITRKYYFGPDFIDVNGTKIDCPRYAARTLMAVDIFCMNINFNIPRREVYYIDPDEGPAKFTIKCLDIKLDEEDRKKETVLADVCTEKSSNRKALSIEFGVEDGFELVTSLIESGGLVR